jgi:hypothetical protein
MLSVNRFAQTQTASIDPELQHYSSKVVLDLFFMYDRTPEVHQTKSKSSILGRRGST